MDRKGLNRIVKKKISALRESATSVVLDNDKESVHELRVAFKKFRASIRLLRSKKNVKKYLRIPEQLKGLYKRAGAIRDRQLYYDLMISYYDQENQGPDFLIELPGEIAARKKNIYRHITAFSFEKLQAETEKHLPKKLGKKTIRKYFSDQKDLCTVMLDEPDSDEKFHTIRKRIKDILFNAELLKNKKAANSIIQKEKELKLIADTVGKYNDTRIAISFLNEYSSNKDEPGLQVIKKEWYEKKDVLKKEIRRQLVQFPWG